MTKTFTFLLLLSVLVFSANISEDYEFCNVTHIQFFSSNNVSAAFPFQVVQDSFDIIGNPEIYNAPPSLFITNPVNFIPIVGSNNSYRYLYMPVVDTYVYFNGAAGYYIKTADGCHANLYQATDIRYNYTNEPFFFNGYSNLNRYGLPYDVYIIQAVQLNGQTIQTDLNNSKLLNQLSNCDHNIHEFNYYNIPVFIPNDVSRCSYAYIIYPTQPINEYGILEAYPAFKFFTMYQIIGYINSERSYLANIDAFIPYWGDLSNLTNCSDQNLTDLTLRMNKISQLQENLNYQEQNIERIVPSDYDRRASERRINESEVTYYLLPSFISAQNELRGKASQLDNKLKLAQDAHKDLISICIQQRAYQAQQIAFQKTMEENEKD
ncbi:MAG: hypothetical protein V1492_00185, partial [Candidatus Micrarchaeota archaeon]